MCRTAVEIRPIRRFPTCEWKCRNVNLLRVFLCDYMNMEIRSIQMLCYNDDAMRYDPVFAKIVTFSNKF